MGEFRSVAFFNRAPEEPARQPRVTVTGQPQTSPERDGGLPRRVRLSVSLLRVLKDHPLARLTAEDVQWQKALGSRNPVTLLVRCSSMSQPSSVGLRGIRAAEVTSKVPNQKG